METLLVLCLSGFTGKTSVWEMNEWGVERNAGKTADQFFDQQRFKPTSRR